MSRGIAGPGIGGQDTGASEAVAEDGTFLKQWGAQQLSHASSEDPRSTWIERIIVWTSSSRGGLTLYIIL